MDTAGYTHTTNNNNNKEEEFKRSGETQEKLEGERKEMNIIEMQYSGRIVSKMLYFGS